jgi:dimethylhistidine N-methyltransferase
MKPKSTNLLSRNISPGVEHFRAEVLMGLSKSQKELPSKYFYDEEGSHLFDLICTLDEYYIPQVEADIMQECIGEVSELIGPDVFLVEYGSGNCRKVRLLLDYLHSPTAYAPIDISWEQLVQVSGELVSDYPDIEMLPVCADYTSSFELPTPENHFNSTVVFFPGSTISNFDPVPAMKFMENVSRACGKNGGLLIGVDLKKEPSILHRAYNDSRGITALFNMNLLARMNRELEADFPLDSFEHYAFYNSRESRIEMHLVSLRNQEVHIGETTISFFHGESIWTESSYKYSLDEFRQMAASTGFKVARVWTDPRSWFSVQYLEKISG